MSGTLRTFGADIARRVRGAVKTAGLGDWAVMTGPPGRLRGRTAWPQIEAVAYNQAMGGLAEVEGAVMFAAPSQGKAGEMDRLVPTLLDNRGFPAAFQAPPYPDGYHHLVSRRATIEPPVTAGEATFVVVRFLFTGLVE